MKICRILRFTIRSYDLRSHLSSTILRRIPILTTLDTWAVSNGRRRICRRTRFGFLMVMENAFLVVFGQWKWISGTAFYVLGLELNQTEMVFARKKVCWHNSCNAYFAIILMRLTMSNDEKVTSTITKDHIRVVHKSYSGRSRTKYLTCTRWHHLLFFFTWLVTI